MSAEKIEAGDVVHHEPSGEDWLILWADYETGRLAPGGWPASEAAISDCRIVAKLSEEERVAFLDKLANSDYPPAQKAVRMYRPADA